MSYAEQEVDAADFAYHYRSVDFFDRHGLYSSHLYVNQIKQNASDLTRKRHQIRGIYLILQVALRVPHWE